MIDLSRPLVIVNPHARSGRAGREASSLLKVMETALGGIDHTFTERPGHATILAKEAALAGRKTVVAVGGDGSIHEVVWGLMAAKEAGATETRLAVLPQGTGGDFRRTFFDLGRNADRHPAHHLDRYLSVIAGGITRAIDVGKFSYIDNAGRPESGYFINILSVGMGGLTDRYVHDTSRYLSGKAAYFIASFRGLLDSAIAPLSLEIDVDGVREERTLHSRQISICNGQFFGSGMHVAPMATLDDGIFDIVDLGDAPMLKFALDSGAIYSGKHMQNPKTTHLRAKKLRLDLLDDRLEDRFLLDVDGEPLGRLPIQVEVMPKALEVVAPAPSR